MKTLIGLLLLISRCAFADPFLISEPVAAHAPIAPTIYAVYGLPGGSPLYFSPVAVAPGKVQLYVDLGPDGLNLPEGSYGVLATASNSQGTSLTTSSYFSFTLPLRTPPSGTPPKGSPKTPVLFIAP